MYVCADEMLPYIKNMNTFPETKSFPAFFAAYLVQKR